MIQLVVGIAAGGELYGRALAVAIQIAARSD
jgi:hypothetical protein